MKNASFFLIILLSFFAKRIMRKFKENYACKLIEFSLQTHRIQPANYSDVGYNQIEARESGTLALQYNNYCSLIQ